MLIGYCVLPAREGHLLPDYARSKEGAWNVQAPNVKRAILQARELARAHALAFLKEGAHGVRIEVYKQKRSCSARADYIVDRWVLSAEEVETAC